jgi:hypothetical protein
VSFQGEVKVREVSLPDITKKGGEGLSENQSPIKSRWEIKAENEYNLDRLGEVLEDLPYNRFAITKQNANTSPQMSPAPAHLQNMRVSEELKKKKKVIQQSPQVRPFP